jgi:hypothetical protein
VAVQRQLRSSSGRRNSDRTQGECRGAQPTRPRTKIGIIKQERATRTDTLLDDIEALRLLWIKEDTSWDTAAVLGEHRKKLRAFSEDYKYRKSKLLGHIIRADNDDPMRKVTFAPSTIVEWGFASRRVGRPKDQWLFESKKTVWKKCRHMEDRQGHKKVDKITKYKETPLQDAWIYTWGEERHF